MVLSIVGLTVFLFAVLLEIKNQITLKHRLRINDAICAYRIDCRCNGQQPCVNYGDGESYEKTWLRLWDWGYKRILPPEKYEIIKPYLQLLKEAQHEKIQ